MPVMAVFRKRIEELLESVLAPISEWVHRQSWLVRVCVLVVLAIGGALWVHPKPAIAGFQKVQYMARAAAAGDAIMLRGELQRATHSARGRLQRSVAADLRQLSGENMVPWSAAQAVTGLGESAPHLGASGVPAFVRSQAEPECFCWTETRNLPDVCVFITGWVMHAFGSLNEPLSIEEWRFPLSTQSPEGWWPIFHDASQRNYASTYATAWMVLGLAEQRRRGLVPVRFAPQVDQAIAGGVDWLLRTRSGARWKSYPYLAGNRASESISGLVVHALHEAGGSDLTDIDRDWLAELPDTPVEADAMELNYQDVRTDGGRRFDHFTQIKLPWMLLATIDAYPSGTLGQRSDALRWIERVLEQRGVQHADANENNWWRAELLYALKHLPGSMKANSTPAAVNDQRATTVRDQALL